MQIYDNFLNAKNNLTSHLSPLTFHLPSRAALVDNPHAGEHQQGGQQLGHRQAVHAGPDGHRDGYDGLQVAVHAHQRGPDTLLPYRYQVGILVNLFFNITFSSSSSILSGRFILFL